MIETLLDAGPLVAFLNGNDQWHGWAKAQMGALIPPLLTCEPVLTEACFLIQRNGGQPADVLKKVQAGVIRVAIEVGAEAGALEFLMRRYSDTPMSLADACLVRLSELRADCQIFTLDSDFRMYRRHGRQIIPLLAPK
jgi:predicted nucleic acid-binding protein